MMLRSRWSLSSLHRGKSRGRSEKGSRRRRRGSRSRGRDAYLQGGEPGLCEARNKSVSRREGSGKKKEVVGRGGEGAYRMENETWSSPFGLRLNRLISKEGSVASGSVGLGVAGSMMYLRWWSSLSIKVRKRSVVPSKGKKRRKKRDRRLT